MDPLATFEPDHPQAEDGKYEVGETTDSVVSYLLALESRRNTVPKNAIGIYIIFKEAFDYVGCVLIG